MGTKGGGRASGFRDRVGGYVLLVRMRYGSPAPHQCSRHGHQQPSLPGPHRSTANPSVTIPVFSPDFAGSGEGQGRPILAIVPPANPVTDWMLPIPVTIPIPVFELMEGGGIYVGVLIIHKTVTVLIPPVLWEAGRLLHRDGGITNNTGRADVHQEEPTGVAAAVSE